MAENFGLLVPPIAAQGAFGAGTSYSRVQMANANTLSYGISFSADRVVRTGSDVAAENLPEIYWRRVS